MIIVMIICVSDRWRLMGTSLCGHLFGALLRVYGYLNIDGGGRWTIKDGNIRKHSSIMFVCLLRMLDKDFGCEFRVKSEVIMETV